jgi:membrane-associated phospholipid phosphatase
MREPDSSNNPPNTPKPENRLLTFLLFSKRAVLMGVLALAILIFLALLPPEGRRALVESLWAERLIVILLAVFTLLMLSLLWAAGQSMDAWLFRSINQGRFRARWIDRLMFWATQAGNGAFSFVVALLLVLFGLRLLALELVLGTLSLWLVVEAVKALTERSRPFAGLDDTNLIGWRERGKSFPSGHTAQVFFMASLLTASLHLGFLGVMLLYVVAALVGFSRIYIGVHYPRDVLAGAIIGSAWGIVGTVVQPYWFAWLA